MTHSSENKIITVLGIDLAKQSFQLHGINGSGKTILKKKLVRNKIAEFMAQLSPCLIGLEACGGSHYWVRVFKKMGHTVRMIAPQFVKPLVKSNKNDAADAEAICEAVQRPSMRFVPAKDVEQQVKGSRIILTFCVVWIIFWLNRFSLRGKNKVQGQ